MIATRTGCRNYNGQPARRRRHPDEPSTHQGQVGNVGQLVNLADGSLAANYEYDPYGNLLTSAGPMADANPFRFSTKYCDDELTAGLADDLYYYGYRFYSPRLGRWLNRDPIEEGDDINVNSFVRNRPTTVVDPRGLTQWCQHAGPELGFNEIRVRGRVQFKDSSTGHVHSQTIDENIDYQIQKTRTINVEIAGPGHDGTMDSGLLFSFNLVQWVYPDVNSIIYHSLNSNHEAIDLTGLACRKRPVCIRECKDCCGKRIGCIFGKHGDWMYGQIRTFMSKYYCELFMPGTKFRLKKSLGASEWLVQPREPICDDHSVKSCGTGVVKECFPRDSRWMN